MRPRILFLTTELPWPVDGGGKLRTVETLACLTRFAEVRLLSVSESPEARGDAQALARHLGLEVEPPIPHPVRIRRKPLALARAAMQGLVRREPYLVAKFRSRAYLECAHRWARRMRPDVVWCDHLNVFSTARRAAALADAALVLDQHNVESDLFARAAGAGWLAPIARWEGARVRRYETAALEEAGKVIAISSDDAERFSRMAGRDDVVTILPSMGELGPCPEPPPPTDRIAFLGTLSWPPNAEGVDWLAREVAPILRRLAPRARLVVGGRGLPPALARRANEAGIELVGWVEDPAAFFRSATAAVVPILSGSGIAMKLLDAMRAGVPVASTHAGARGLPLRDGEELLLAKNAEELAKAIARLLDDEALRRRLVRGAWSYLERNHARDALARRYREVVEAAQRMRDARAGGVR